VVEELIPDKNEIKIFETFKKPVYDENGQYYWNNRFGT
jgi:hypothetical protein